ncbi:MAG: DNA gyrase subunit A [Luteolibacter sp.]
METSFSVNMLAIHKNRPKQLSLKEAIDAYIEHRREVVIRRTRYLLGKAEERAELLEAFLLALGHLDEFIQIIRSSKNRDEARERLAAYNFPVATAEGLGILIRSQPSVAGGSLHLHRTPGECHPRAAPLSAHRHGAATR